MKCEDNSVMQVHDGTGKPVLEHRDTASSNANKFNLAMDDENIDFNISGVPNAMVKRSHGINVYNLIQQIENHPQREALQRDLQQHRIQSFSKESKVAIMAVGNTELCEIIDMEPKSQCRACLTHWSAGIVYCTCGHLMTDDSARTNSRSQLCLIRSPSLTSTSGRAGHTVTGMEKHLDAKNTTRQSNFKRGVERRKI